MPKASNSQLRSEKPRKAQNLASKGKKTSKDAGSDVKKAYDVANPELLKRLVDNEETVRAEGVLTVARMVSSKRLLALSDLQKLWRGLWFAMWHSDTPIVQQKLARDLADLFLHTHAKNEVSFVEAFWFIMLREWETLDRYRINKFYMLVRFVLNAQLTRLKLSGWSEAEVAQFASQLVSEETGPLSYANTRSPHSLRLHLADIFLDELDKVLDKSTPSLEVLKVVLSPVLSQPELSEFKHVKQKVIEDVQTDERLAEWGLTAKVEKAEVEESGESDWEGFD